MSDGFPNKPKILRGAFVEYGLSLPPLFVVFQFNPVQLSRSRTQAFSAPGSGVQQAEYESPRAAGRTAQSISLRDYHQRFEDLAEIRDAQQVRIQEESINFEIRLDATDHLNDGDVISEQFGIAPQLSTLELMVHPKEESLSGQALGRLLGSPGGFSYTKKPNPPMILFIWGRKRVLPVNINSLSITESEFSSDLNPIRATVAVNLTVIEGKNRVYMYTKAMKEMSSVLNQANSVDIADVVIPG